MGKLFQSQAKYMRNIKKSVKSLSGDLLYDYAPELRKTIASSQQALTAFKLDKLRSRQAISQTFRSSMKATGQYIGETFSTFKKQISSGKLYDDSRESVTAVGSFMKDYGSDGDSGNIDEIVANLEGGSKSSKITDTAIIESAQYSAENANLIAAQEGLERARHHIETTAEMSNISSLLSSSLKLHATVIAPNIQVIAESMSGVFERQDKMIQLLEKIANDNESDRARMRGTTESYIDTKYSRIRGDDSFNVDAYSRMVGENIKNTVSPLLDGVKTILDSIKTNPVGELMKAVSKRLTPKAMKTGMSKAGKNAMSLGDSLLMSLTDLQRSDNIISSTVGRLFGLDPTRMAAVDTSKYLKDPITLESENKKFKAITEVIPEYLNAIAASLTGESKIFNYKTGKFVSKRKAAEKLRDNLRSTSTGDLDDIANVIRDAVSTINSKGKAGQARAVNRLTDDTISQFFVVMSLLNSNANLLSDEFTYSDFKRAIESSGVPGLELADDESDAKLIFAQMQKLMKSLNGTSKGSFGTKLTQSMARSRFDMPNRVMQLNQSARDTGVISVFNDYGDPYKSPTRLSYGMGGSGSRVSSSKGATSGTVKDIGEAVMDIIPIVLAKDIPGALAYAVNYGMLLATTKAPGKSRGSSWYAPEPGGGKTHIENMADNIAADDIIRQLSNADYANLLGNKQDADDSGLPFIDAIYKAIGAHLGTAKGKFKGSKLYKNVINKNNRLDNSGIFQLSTGIREYLYGKDEDEKGNGAVDGVLVKFSNALVGITGSLLYGDELDSSALDTMKKLFKSEDGGDAAVIKNALKGTKLYTSLYGKKDDGSDGLIAKFERGFIDKFIEPFGKFFKEKIYKKHLEPIGNELLSKISQKDKNAIAGQVIGFVSDITKKPVGEVYKKLGVDEKTIQSCLEGEEPKCPVCGTPYNKNEQGYVCSKCKFTVKYDQTKKPKYWLIRNKKEYNLTDAKAAYNKELDNMLSNLDKLRYTAIGVGKGLTGEIEAKMDEALNSNLGSSINSLIHAASAIETKIFGKEGVFGKLSNAFVELQDKVHNVSNAMDESAKTQNKTASKFTEIGEEISGAIKGSVEKITNSISGNEENSLTTVIHNAGKRLGSAISGFIERFRKPTDIPEAAEPKGDTPENVVESTGDMTDAKGGTILGKIFGKGKNNAHNGGVIHMNDGGEVDDDAEVVIVGDDSDGKPTKYTELLIAKDGKVRILSNAQILSIANTLGYTGSDKDKIDQVSILLNQALSNKGSETKFRANKKLSGIKDDNGTVVKKIVDGNDVHAISNDILIDILMGRVKEEKSELTSLPNAIWKALLSLAKGPGGGKSATEELSESWKNIKDSFNDKKSGENAVASGIMISNMLGLGSMPGYLLGSLYKVTKAGPKSQYVDYVKNARDSGKTADDFDTWKKENAHLFTAASVRGEKLAKTGAVISSIFGLGPIPGLLFGTLVAEKRKNKTKGEKKDASKLAEEYAEKAEEIKGRKGLGKITGFIGDHKKGLAGWTIASTLLGLGPIPGLLAGTLISANKDRKLLKAYTGDKEYGLLHTIGRGIKKGAGIGAGALASSLLGLGPVPGALLSIYMQKKKKDFNDAKKEAEIMQKESLTKAYAAKHGENKIDNNKFDPKCPICGKFLKYDENTDEFTCHCKDDNSIIVQAKYDSKEGMTYYAGDDKESKAVYVTAKNFKKTKKYKDFKNKYKSKKDKKDKNLISRIFGGIKDKLTNNRITRHFGVKKILKKNVKEKQEALKQEEANPETTSAKKKKIPNGKTVKLPRFYGNRCAVCKKWTTTNLIKLPEKLKKYYLSDDEYEEFKEYSNNGFIITVCTNINEDNGSHGGCYTLNGGDGYKSEWKWFRIEDLDKIKDKIRKEYKKQKEDKDTDFLEDNDLLHKNFLQRIFSKKKKNDSDSQPGSTGDPTQPGAGGNPAVADQTPRNKQEESNDNPGEHFAVGGVNIGGKIKKGFNSVLDFFKGKFHKATVGEDGREDIILPPNSAVVPKRYDRQLNTELAKYADNQSHHITTNATSTNAGLNNNNNNTVKLTERHINDYISRLANNVNSEKITYNEAAYRLKQYCSGKYPYEKALSMLNNLCPSAESSNDSSKGGGVSDIGKAAATAGETGGLLGGLFNSLLGGDSKEMSLKDKLISLFTGGKNASFGTKAKNVLTNLGTAHAIGSVALGAKQITSGVNQMQSDETIDKVEGSGTAGRGAAQVTSGALRLTGQVAKGVTKGLAAKSTAAAVKSGTGILQKVTAFLTKALQGLGKTKFGKIIASKAGPIAAKIAKTAAGKLLGKAAQFIANWSNPIGWGIVIAQAVYDFTTGMADVRNILKLDSSFEPPLKLKITAGACKMISGFLLGLVPVDFATDIVYNLIASDAEKEELKEAKEKQKSEYDNFIKAHPEAVENGLTEEKFNSIKNKSTWTKFVEWLPFTKSSSLDDYTNGSGTTVVDNTTNVIINSDGGEGASEGSGRGPMPDRYKSLIDQTKEILARNKDKISKTREMNIIEGSGRGGEKPNTIGNPASMYISSSIPYYSQKDNRWKDIQYGLYNSLPDTIGDGGCGPTVAAMMFQGLTGKVQTPFDLSSEAYSKGYKGDGTNYKFFKAAGKDRGIGIKSDDGLSRTAIDKLSEGIPVALLGRDSNNNPPFGNSNHFVLAGKYDEASNGIAIYDPQNPSNNRVYPLGDISRYTKKAIIPDISTEMGAGSRTSVTIPTSMTRAALNDKRRNAQYVAADNYNAAIARGSASDKETAMLERLDAMISILNSINESNSQIAAAITDRGTSVYGGPAVSAVPKSTASSAMGNNSQESTRKQSLYNRATSN